MTPITQNISPESLSQIQLIEKYVSKSLLFYEDIDIDHMSEDFPELTEKEAEYAAAYDACYGSGPKEGTKEERANRLAKIAKELHDAKLALLGEFEVVHAESGYEGGGENVELVIYLPERDEYYAAYAWYASYDGINDWGDWQRVYPHKVVNIEYKPNPQT